MMRTIDELAFRLKWLVMTPRARYAYLWNRTRSRAEEEYFVSARKQ